jgi:hypothetical protein
LDDVGLDKQLRPVTNRANRFSLIKKLAREFNRFLFHAKFVAVQCTAGDKKTVVVVSTRLVQLHIHGNELCPGLVFPRPDLAFVRRNNVTNRTAFLKRVERLEQFSFLESVRSEHGNPLFIECSHGFLPKFS